MAQLSANAFGSSGDFANVEEVAALIGERTPVVVGSETIALIEADGRVLAEDLIASLDLPGFANSAVDGYAVAHADLSATAETLLSVKSRTAAGEAAQPIKGAAARIFTGAAMPAGADTVFMQEDVRIAGPDTIGFPPGLPKAANVRARGEDISRGAVALVAGQRLDPRHIALASALGADQLLVRKALRVAVFSTGDELAGSGQTLGAAQIYDANRFALAALLRRQGCLVSDLGILRDDAQAIAAKLSDAAAHHDLIVTSGGVSVGEEDHVRSAIQNGGSLVFWRLAIKPGRPVAMGVLAGTPIVGLPGNPVAVFIAFAFVARPLIAALAGETYRPPVATSVQSGFDYAKKKGRREFVRAGLARDSEGNWIAHKHPMEGAAVITSLTATDGLAVLPEATQHVAIGDRVDFIAYGLLF